MAESFEVLYRRLLALVRSPNQENWYQRYEMGARISRVEQGRRLVIETLVLPEIKFMLDLQNVRAGLAWSDFMAAKNNLVRLAPAWSDPDWEFTSGAKRDMGTRG